MPPEELHDLASDRHEIDNLATSGDPQHRAARERLRGILKRWIIETNDQGEAFESPEIAAAKGVTRPGSNPNAGYLQGDLKE
jgi:hypothetical protein